MQVLDCWRKLTFRGGDRGGQESRLSRSLDPVFQIKKKALRDSHQHHQPAGTITGQGRARPSPFAGWNFRAFQMERFSLRFAGRTGQLPLYQPPEPSHAWTIRFVRGRTKRRVAQDCRMGGVRGRGGYPPRTFSRSSRGRLGCRQRRLLGLLQQEMQPGDLLLSKGPGGSRQGGPGDSQPQLAIFPHGCRLRTGGR